MPDFHRLNKTKTTEMSREELNRRLREEEEKKKAKKAKSSYKGEHSKPSKKQQKISEQTKKQLPPQSPAKKQREEEYKKRRIEEEKRRKQIEKEQERARKRRKRGSNVIYYVSAAVIAAVIFVILSVTVLFNADKIVVEGETIYSEEEIIAASGLTGTENLVRLSTSGIPNRILNQLVCLDSAEVSKIFPSTIKITVTPAVPMANFYYAGMNYVISHVGRVMEIADESADCMEVIGYQPGDSISIGDYITAADPQQDELIATISAAAEKAGLDSITRLDISDPLGIVITYDNRVRILIGSVLELDQKMTIAVNLVKEQIRPEERVSLDITNTERAVQRPLTSYTAATSAPITEEIPEETEEHGDYIE